MKEDLVKTKMLIEHYKKIEKCIATSTSAGHIESCKKMIGTFENKFDIKGSLEATSIAIKTLTRMLEDKEILVT